MTVSKSEPILPSISPQPAASSPTRLDSSSQVDGGSFHVRVTPALSVKRERRYNADSGALVASFREQRGERRRVVSELEEMHLAEKDPVPMWPIEVHTSRHNPVDASLLPHDEYGRQAEARAKFRRKKKEVPKKLPPLLPPGAEVCVSAIRAYGVPDADAKKGSGGSDPYFTFSLAAGDELCLAKTTVHQNDGDCPDWSSEPPLRLELARGAKAGASVVLKATIWDKDFTNDDDALASGGVPVACETAGKKQSVDIMMKGEPGWPDVRATFEYEVQLPKPKAKGK